MDRTFGVAELNHEVARTIGEAFPTDVWVRGEVSDAKYRGGHLYFELLERSDGAHRPARLRVCLFRYHRERIEFQLARAGVEFADGVALRVRGRIDYWADGNQLNLKMTGIDPAFTLGKLAADRDRVLRALQADGLLDRNRSLPLPLVPLTVGLVSARGSAAYEDVVYVLEASGIGFRVLAADARVQGDASEATVVHALRAVASRGADVIILARGGGSRSDLAWFDREPIARAVATAPVPVLTGIGHETDTAVADRVAYASYTTPTACAAAIVARVADFLAGVDRSWQTISDRATRRTASEHETLRRHAARLERATSTLLTLHTARLEASDARARAHDPRLVLARGYSITRTDDGALVRSGARVRAG
ncbi:MAG: exodeoxyribonuclease VII large subunit, partial [Actinobacteria bacterium]|nr:exodeoxyribonuclease VII large subunit [Actinomycetota bacterium]